MGKIRESPIAGSWYPGNKSELEGEINGFLAKATPEKIAGNLVAIISPHAGYRFSGGVAAYGYKLLKGLSFDTVVVFSPSHHVPFRGVAVYPTGGFKTPLGVIPVDEEICAALMAENPIFRDLPQAHAQEHSLEIQLPFLQVVLGNFKLVPLMMISEDFNTCQQIAETLTKVISKSNKKVLLVASTDLSHYHSYDKAVELDKIVGRHIGNFAPEALAGDLRRGICEACGGWPTVTVMLAAASLGADKAKVLKYANSGDVTGDKHGTIVGYMSAALYTAQNARSKADKENIGVNLGLTEQEKETLHKIAKLVIENKTLKKRYSLPEITSETLRELRGAFVTIKKRGQLRGCIGYVRALKPLYKTIEDMAKAAAFSDPRFPSVEAAELPELEIEISVLTPLQKISDTSKIEVGKHGLSIRKGYYSGLLLPQVPVEYGWDRIAFLEHTCRKAGLPPNAWQDKDVELYIFSADVF